jgi:hypothetical protein
MSQLPKVRGQIRVKSRVLALAVLGGACLWVALAPGPARPAPPAEQDARALFDTLAAGEGEAWRKAKEDWPQHRWSQQDAFSAFERDHVTALARDKHLSPQDVFDVLDRGIRGAWPGPDGGALDPTVVPLKMRPMD